MNLNYRRRGSQLGAGYQVFKSSRPDADAILDGVDVPRPMYSTNWVLESRVHKTVKLTDDVRSTRNFVGPQVNVLRDDLRRLSFAIHIEGDTDRLVLTEIKDSKVVRQVEIDDRVWRADLSLDKYSGKPRVLYTKISSGSGVLFLDGQEISTQDSDIDFPFMDVSQLPIGHIPAGPAAYSVMTYKSRATGRIYYRKVTDNGIEGERLLFDQEAIGGASLAVIGNKIIFQINVKNGNDYQPSIISSLDGGNTLEGLEALDIKSSSADQLEYQAYTATPIVDYSGMVHVPVVTRFPGGVRLMDVLVEDSTATEAIEILAPNVGSAVGTLARFPKTVCATHVVFDGANLPVKQDFRVGDGVTDGIGIIGVLLDSGKLFTSNSQSGGFSYPDKAHLNHEMMDMATLATTECYTSGKKPNTVSMDYIFLEAIESRLPISGELHLETWDMPLPIPLGKAVLVSSDTIELTIINNGNFLAGGIEVDIDHMVAKVTDITVADHRKAYVKFTLVDGLKSLLGHPISIRSRNVFYYHELNLKIE
jgi:hypothetical protein